MRLKRALQVSILKVAGQNGVYRQENTDIFFDGDGKTVQDFYEMARRTMLEPMPVADVEKWVFCWHSLRKFGFRNFWTHLEDTEKKGVYGADVSGTLFGKDVDSFNMNNLNTMLTRFQVCLHLH